MSLPRFKKAPKPAQNPDRLNAEYITNNLPQLDLPCGSKVRAQTRALAGFVHVRVCNGVRHLRSARARARALVAGGSAGSYKPSPGFPITRNRAFCGEVAPRRGPHTNVYHVFTRADTGRCTHARKSMHMPAIYTCASTCARARYVTRSILRAFSRQKPTRNSEQCTHAHTHERARAHTHRHARARTNTHI